MDLQQNERLIKPVSVWIPMQGKVYANMIRFDDLQHYSFKNQSALATWSLWSVNGDVFRNITKGVVEITPEILAEWSTDDAVIFNYITQQLQLVTL